jgi:hypothetical protein
MEFNKDTQYTENKINISTQNETTIINNNSDEINDLFISSFDKNKSKEHFYSFSCIDKKKIDEDISLAKNTLRDGSPLNSITIYINDLVDKTNKYGDFYTLCSINGYEFEYDKILELKEVQNTLKNYYQEYGNVRIVKSNNNKSPKIVIYF